MKKETQELLLLLAEQVSKRQKLEQKINAIRRDYRARITAANVEIASISERLKEAK